MNELLWLCKLYHNKTLKIKRKIIFIILLQVTETIRILRLILNALT